MAKTGGNFLLRHSFLLDTARRALRAMHATKHSSLDKKVDAVATTNVRTPELMVPMIKFAASSSCR